MRASCAVDTVAAQALPGVAAVLTAADVPGRNAFGRIIPDQPAFAVDVVRYIGDPVACVFAETAAAAEEACRLVQVDYEALPGVFSPEAAAQPDAPRLHEKGNLLKEVRVRRGQPDEAFAGCAVVIEGDYTTPFVEHGYIEPESGLGLPDDDGGVTLLMPTQAAWDDRRELAAILALPREKVRVGAVAHRRRVRGEGRCAPAPFPGARRAAHRPAGQDDADARGVAAHARQAPCVHDARQGGRRCRRPAAGARKRG